MLYKHNTEGCFKSKIGEYGVDEQDFSNLLAESSQIIEELKDLPHLKILENSDDLVEIETLSTKIKGRFKHLIVLGTGGSTLSGQAFTGLVHECSPKVIFADNVDPDSFKNILNNINISDSCFLVISKSGGTLETLAQFAICLEEVEKSEGRDNIKNHFYIISDPKPNTLRNIGEKFDIEAFNHEEEIGGRFSAFTNVGLLPAAVAGLDINLIRKGAINAANDCIKNSPENYAPAVGAAINVLLMQKNIRTAVMMPYIDRLANFTSLYRQIWAESLGKEGNGSTPVKSSGTLDQHSQLQLYLDGARDKIFTFITLNDDADAQKINPDFLPDEKFSYVHNKTLNDVIKVNGSATISTLIKNNCPVRNIEINRLDEEVIGELLMHFMLETIITAKMLKINPFDQPAVEQGKILAKQLLEEKR